MSHHKAVLAETFKQWLPLGITIFLMTGLAYGLTQQNYRMTANDPQIQIAEDVATAINNGSAAPDAIVSTAPTTDISASLSAFVAIYSATGTPIGSSVALDGKLPTVPSFILDYAKTHGEFRETWEPKPGVRIAAVVTKFNGPQSGYVLAGRSLREVEIREQKTFIISVIAGLLMWILSFLVMWWNTKSLPHHHHEHEPVAEEPKA